MSYKFSPSIREAQDLGEEFRFEEDTGALKSILNNQGNINIISPQAKIITSIY